MICLEKLNYYRQKNFRDVNHFTGADDFQNMFAYQPAFSKLQLKKG